MWGHVSDDGLMDLVEGSGPAAARTHVEACARCRERVAAAQEALGLAHGASVPEPPQAYWEAMRRRIGRLIVAETSRGGFGLRPALAAAAALVALLGLLPVRVAREAPRDEAPPAWSALPVPAEDAGLAVLQGLDADEDELVAMTSRVSLADIVSALSDAESQDLAQALRAELNVGPS